MFWMGLIVGGVAGMCFMCLFQFEKKTEQRTTVDEDIDEEVKSCAEYIKDYCDWQGKSCKGCVLFDDFKHVCKCAGLPKDWGAIE